MILTRNQAKMVQAKKRSKSLRRKKTKAKTKRIKKVAPAKEKVKKKKQAQRVKKPVKNVKQIKEKKKRASKKKKQLMIKKINKNLPTNSTNLEEPAKAKENVLDKVSLENSKQENQPKGRYSFRKRVVKMKENPSEFKERWGVVDPKEDVRFYKEEKRRDPFWFTKRRRSSGESYDANGDNRKRGFSKRGNPNRRLKNILREIESETDEEERERIENLHPCRFDMLLLQKLPGDYKDLMFLSNQIKTKVASSNKYWFYEQEEQIKKMKSDVTEQSIPVYADVQDFNWNKLREDQLECGGRLFDVIMMDPPWQLSSSQPSRGVAIGYSSLSDDMISKIPIKTLQVEGFLFIWVINVKYGLALKLFEKWGYQLIDEIVWIKRTVTGKIAKGHGFYLQHSKETCLVGFKGDMNRYLPKNDLKISETKSSKKRKQKISNKVEEFKGIAQDVIFSERRGQSQKPNEIYNLIEKMVPNGFYLEIFGRRNNLRSKWVTIGNEI